ncbi:hypothetical protein LPB140_08850 [Sphingorhabdus lutea]|uniref:Uncharacterized protein n=2 Tax=Sphingorhabdus lutea TaxID=1913578 RepID=A0A1L3JFA4_9SPHN|nr:hypothetical protein LPB140_08850 [Sphingorhabdus lutea]
MVSAAPANAQNGSIDGEEPDMFEGSEIFACPDGKYQSGCDIADVEKAILSDASSFSNIGQNCLYAVKANCSVIAAGQINISSTKTQFHWQHLSLQPKDGPHVEMMILFTNENEPEFFSAMQVEGFFDAPILVRDDDRAILHVPARNRGLGSADQIFYSTGNSWNVTTAYNIERQVNKLLPQNFQLASPIFFNLREASAFSLVRRHNDAGCCATGGTVNIDFEVRDYVLEVSQIAFNETIPVGNPKYTSSGDSENHTEGGSK